jgi:ATP-binding cassette subfamily F protein uup
VARPSKPRKLTFKEKSELNELPDRIDALEQERDRLHVSLSDPVLLRDGSAVAQTRARLAGIEEEIAESMRRWEALETIAARE